MDLLSWSPAGAVFWGGLAVMTWASWAYRRRPEPALRTATYYTGSVADQAERWLQTRAGLD